MKEEAGKHAYDKGSFIKWYQRSSVGIYQWQERAGGKGLKKGKVIVRISGKGTDSKDVFDLADKVVEKLDEGTFDGRKTISI